VQGAESGRRGIADGWYAISAADAVCSGRFPTYAACEAHIEQERSARISMPITKVRRISIELEQPTKRDNDSRPFVDVLLADIRKGARRSIRRTCSLTPNGSRDAGAKNLLLKPS
jgi:hypothetical protein